MLIPSDRAHDRVVHRPYVLDRYVPLYPIDDARDDTRIAAVARRASFLLAWPSPGRDACGRRRLRGAILASLELGGDLDVPDLWQRREGRLEPFVFLRRFERDAAYGWLAGLWLGRDACFTTTGLDVQRIVDAPACDTSGRLLFDLIGDAPRH